MNVQGRCAIGLAAALVAVGCAVRSFVSEVPVREAWPADAWLEATPERRGLDSGVLAEAVRYVREAHLALHGIVLVRGGDVVLDARFYPYVEDVPHDVASVTKSVTATLLGLAIADGLIPSLDTPVAEYFPEHAAAFADPRKKALTVGDLAAMRAGFACGHDPREAELKRMIRAPDWVDFALALPMETAADEGFAYCSPGSHLLAATIARAVGEDLETYARRRLFAPLGIRDLAWPRDPQGRVHGWGDLRLKPRDMARLGWLYLNDGRWEGRRLLPAGWVERATRWRSGVEGPLGYGLGWWLVDEEGFRRFEARGRGGQLVVVWPEGDLVAVLVGAGYDGARLGEFLRRALRSNGPLPENPEGVASLRDEIALARRAPEVHAVPPPPAAAASLAGRAWRLEENELQLDTLALDFPGGAEARVTLAIRGETYPFAVGLDGVPRRTARTPTGVPVGMTGRWEGARFVAEYAETAGANRFTFAVGRAGEGIDVEVTDPTGMWSGRLAGRLSE